MDWFTTKEDPTILEIIEEIKKQNKLNVDEYTKIKMPPTAVQSFYAGKSIFMTGATGFMGKCFVEKMLRDCPDLNKLYLLIRSKKGLSVGDITKQYFTNPIFDRLRKIDPNFEDKVVPLKGDLQEEKLGLSAEDRQLLIDNVDIMVHNGATVRFNEAVSVALKINVLGTKNMLDLAMACKHMKAFAYVSTAYSHCHMKHIKEEFYEPPADLKIVHDMIAADEAAKFGLSEEVVNMFLGKWPNIYTFTKSMAEDLVRQYGEKANFGCCVYRPSIVIGSYKEPRIGWTGNRNGPTTIFVASALGVIHALYYIGEPLDLVPVDYSINILIVCIYDVANCWKIEKRPRVYNFASSVANPTNIKSLYYKVHEMLCTLGTEKSVWHLSTVFTSNKWLFYMLHFLVHFIPALFADLALLLMGRKPKAVSTFFSVTKQLHWLIHFMNFGWRIHVTETKRVYDAISDADRKIFNFDIWKLDWKQHTGRCMCGIRTFVLKEALDNLDKAKRHSIIMKVTHYAFLTVLYLIVGYVFFKKMYAIIFPYFIQQ